MPLSRVTITISRDLVKRADRLARQGSRSRSAVLADALAAHVDAVERQAGGAARVAEPVRGPYGPSGAGPLAGASDEALLAEVGRRLVRATGRTGSAGGAPRLMFDRAQLSDLCRRRHIRRLALFGSVLTDAFGPDSDVDVLVEFEPGHTPGLAIADVEDELSRLFGGRTVDLVTERSLHPLIRDRVAQSAVEQYAG